MSLLEEGVTSMGATSRSYDKYGKRVWTATPKKDSSKKDRSLPVRKVVAGKDGATNRTSSDVGIM